LRHQVIDIPSITPVVIEHRLHRLVCPCCSTSTCATLPAAVEATHYGPRLSALVGLLGSAFPLSFSKTQALLQHLLVVAMSRGEIATICQRLSAALARPMQEALAFVPVSSRWPMWLKPAPSPATPTATIPRASGAGSGSWSPLW
jgi:transposase